MKILVTGGTGFIGRALVRALLAEGHELTVYSRRPAAVAGLLGPQVGVLADLDTWSPDIHFDAVINLAGEPIIGRWWTEARKRVLWDSRVTLTDRLVAALARTQVKPSVLISGSAIGIYGDHGNTPIDEWAAVEPATGFAGSLCSAWETSALRAREAGIRVCLLRTGLVVGPRGGFLARMLPAFRLALGGPIGTGRQWMSWIHVADQVGLILFLLKAGELDGTFNATAPEPVTNQEFTRILADKLKRPAFLKVPAGLLRIAMGEMSGLLLGSQRVIPTRAMQAGFRFSFETLDAALDNVLDTERH
jgi:uncharacterized protein (TIGR01777 family)